MEFGNDNRYTCPSCKKNMYEQTYTSYWSSKKAMFSDGSETENITVLSADITPNLAKCPHCSELVFLHKLKKTEMIVQYSEEDLKDKQENRKYIEKPDLNDLIKAEKDGLAKNDNEEIELRTRLWRMLNKNKLSGSELEV